MGQIAAAVDCLALRSVGPKNEAVARVRARCVAVTPNFNSRRVQTLGLHVVVSCAMGRRKKRERSPLKNMHQCRRRCDSEKGKEHISTGWSQRNGPTRTSQQAACHVIDLGL